MLGEAQGEYIWFLDSDDKLLPGAIPALHQIVQGARPRCGAVRLSSLARKPRLKHRLRGEAHRHTFDGPSHVLQYGPTGLLRGLWPQGSLHAWSKITRRALWVDGVRFPEGSYFEDMATMPLALIRANSYYYMPQPGSPTANEAVVF